VRELQAYAGSPADFFKKGVGIEVFAMGVWVGVHAMAEALRLLPSNNLTRAAL
jgi:hypothetical protein